jgi:aerobic carbon-monoxide dehydrogenase large subunit
MNDAVSTAASHARFAVGQPVPRKEDPTLVQGRGRYTDDLHLPGEAFAWPVRSGVAHGILRGVGTEAARDLPGVLAIYTGADLERAGYKPLGCGMPLKNRDGTPMRQAPLPGLASDRVRFVGQPVAMVIAETLAAAKDAAEAVEVEIETLPAVVDPEAALAAGAPLLHEGVPGNMVLDWQGGDAAAADAAFARAAHVTRLRVVNNRVVVASMEPRGAIAEVDPETGRLTLHVGCQGAFGMRSSLAAVLGLEVSQVRVLTYQVGGSFGMKAPVYPEYLPLCLAARELGRPVRWMDERTGSFLSDYHGRDTLHDAELALDEDGRFLAVRVSVIGNMGAHLVGAGPIIPSSNILKNGPSLYRTPAFSVRSRCALTNTVPTHAYRGAGRPEANYLMERLVDQAARELKVDPVELRRRNLIRKDEIPFKAPSGMTYDSGDFPAVLEAALERADWSGYEARRRDSEGRGRLRGRGISTYLEVTAPPSREMGGIRFEDDGRVTIITGTLDYGQGHASPFAQVLAERLGVPFEAIDLVQGDSDQLQAGGGTGGSRSIMTSGTAILAAADQVIEHGRRLASHILEAAAADITFEDGRFTIAGTDRAIGIMELAARVRDEERLPEGLPARLDAALVSDDPGSAFPNGCHVVEVEVDPETGVVEIVRYVAVDDFGTVVNPLLVEGQVHGGVAQGIGQALCEHTVFSEDGQLLSGSFMDYCLPRADLVPPMDVGFHPVPATTNPLGVKGCGEAGVSGSCPAIMGAIVDALAPLGVTNIDMPATPERVWQAIAAARR